MFLSKMTAAVLDDLNYIVDPSAVRSETAYGGVHINNTTCSWKPFSSH